MAAAQSSQEVDSNFGGYGFGHSMVVDPWGDIIAQCSDKEGITLCEIDLDYLYSVRANMTCLQHVNTKSLL